LLNENNKFRERKKVPSFLATKTRVFIINTFSKKGGDTLDGYKKESH